MKKLLVAAFALFCAVAANAQVKNYVGIVRQKYYPAQEEFFKIVEELADRYGIDKDKENLRLEANRWEITHNGFSGRTATQFIDHLRGKTGTA